MAKIRCVKIHLMPAARDRAARVLFPNGGKDYQNFTGPDFQDIKHPIFCGETVGVALQDDSEYHYPLHQVARVKVYYKEVVA